MPTNLHIMYLASRHHSVGVSVAVSTEGGLITPIVFGADTKVSPSLPLIGFMTPRPPSLRSLTFQASHIFAHSQRTGKSGDKGYSHGAGGHV